MSKKKKTEVEEITKAMKAKLPDTTIPIKNFLSTGSTLLNIACSGKRTGGFFKGCYVWLVGDSESGKAQPLDSKILTPNGWVLMSDVRVGTKIIDPDGGISKVTAIHPQGKQPVFELMFSDGAKVRATPDHLWLTETSKGRLLGRKPRLRTTKELTDRIQTTVNFRHPICKPVSFSAGGELPLDPYILGALLGNGLFAKTITISSEETHIISKIERLLPKGHSLQHQHAGTFRLIGIPYKGKGTVRLNQVRRAIISLGLNGRRAHTKFIPEKYLRASIKDRVKLFQGMMDTDGEATAGGALCYSTASKILADGMIELVRSLGGVVRKPRIKHPHYTYKGVRKQGRPSYNLSIGVPEGLIPFTLERKLNRFKARLARAKSKKNAGKATGRKPFAIRTLVSARKLKQQECQCISTNSKQGLYITDDYVVTHNTWSAYTCLAEAARNKNFKDYRFIVDQAEDGALMDVEHFFGTEMVSRLEPPAVDGDGEPVYSQTLEDFYYNLDDAHKRGTPFIYILDSHDALDSNEDEKKFDKTKAARRKGKDDTGSYGTSKAKLNSAFLRRAVGRLRKTGSILIIISQSRDSIRFGSQFAPKTAAGGRALKFYAHLELWTSIARTIKKRVRGKNRQVGIYCKVAVKKNRVVGRKRSVEFPIYWSLGIDEIGGCVNYLIDEGYWKGSETGEKVKAKDFNFEGTREDLIAKIEKEGLEKELQLLVHKVWNEIDEGCIVERKRRYV